VVAVRVSGDPVPANNGLFYLYTDRLASTSFLTDSSGEQVGDTIRYYPYGEYRTEPSTGAITDRGYTSHKHNDSLGLVFMNARFYLASTGRFLSADTIVPDPMNPQSYNRYPYVYNNPTRYTDPSGHCAAGDDDCWLYLENHFCQNIGCSVEGWSSRVIVNENSIWTLQELTTLHDALFDMRLAFDIIGVDWGATGLTNTRYQRKQSGDQQSLPWNLITLSYSTIEKQDIWHEAAHQLDWDNYRHLSNDYLSIAGGCSGVCESKMPSGSYYRDYAWDFALGDHGPVYSFLFGRMEPFADAFAAWVSESTTGKPHIGWIEGRAALPQHTPDWPLIIGSVDKILKVYY
jgi:RHS repeat-associated protein